MDKRNKDNEGVGLWDRNTGHRQDRRDGPLAGGATTTDIRKMTCSIGGIDTELRTALVIEAESMSRHCDLVRGLKSKFGHTIRCLERPGDGTCATYALDLLETYRPLVKELQDFGIRPGRNFMRWLVEGDHLTEIPAIRDEALVCYFLEGHGSMSASRLPVDGSALNGGPMPFSTTGFRKYLRITATIYGSSSGRALVQQRVYYSSSRAGKWT